MARTKSAASTLVDEKIEVESKKEVVTEKIEETPKETKSEVKEEPKVEKPKVKTFADNEEVTICCDSLVGKTCVISETTTIKFDETGKAKVKGFEAKRLLTIPGYRLA